uniref:Uncharacterized protein n=1 Tax=Solibacter usitatus (strain Ellin6076) TaxID=234267 RepID=Q028K0_SOLUE
MTPVPLDLPLRPAEATELASLIFEHAERKPLTEELRYRLASRAAVLKLQSVTPHFGSLERDPVHPSAYYLAVDAQQGTPQLLYLATATAPTSSIYHKALLIGRMRRANGPEMVINAIPFGPWDRENIETFAARINHAFYPQPQGGRSTITIEEDPAAAFALFRALQKRTGKNFAALSCDYHAAVWAAIRTGWRTGYTVGADVSGAIPEAAYSRYSVNIPATAEGWKIAGETHRQVRRVRSARKITRGFEFEVILDGAVSPERLRGALEHLRAGSHAAQLAGGSWTGDVEGIAAVARQFQVTLSSCSSGFAPDPARFNYRVKTVADAESLAERFL